MDGTTHPNPTTDATQRPPIVIRKPEFGLSDDLPKYFWKDEPGVTAFAYALSSVFPDGERFFIDAVRNYKDRITDDTLRRQVMAFGGQEAQHGRIHEAYNEYAERKGFAVRDVVGYAKSRTEALKKTAPKIAQLAATAALEHFTALMAEQLLGDARFGDGVPEEHALIWRWHAAEEAEHKAVAFDVFQHVSGSYAIRIRSYAITSIMFPLTTLGHTFYLMHKDGTLLDPKAQLGLFKFLFVSPGLVPAVIPGWLDYFRPDFHPWDRDDRALLERWKREWAPGFV